MSDRLFPLAIRVGLTCEGAPALEVCLSDGMSVLIPLEVSQAGRIADRLRECVDGRILQRPPSRRSLELTIGFPEDESSTSSAVVPVLEASPRTEGAFP